MGRDGTFAQNHFFGIDVIVYGVEGFHRSHAGSFQQDFRHFFAVSSCEALADLYVVKVIFQEAAVQPAKVFRRIQRLGLKVSLHFLQRTLDFLPSALGFVFCDQLVMIFLLCLFCIVIVYI